MLNNSLKPKFEVYLHLLVNMITGHIGRNTSQTSQVNSTTKKLTDIAFSSSIRNAMPKENLENV